MKKRRNLRQLELAVGEAKMNDEKALAYYNLALFHDNNSRESLAIPNYEKALQLGLKGELKAQALAWLASSLNKTDQLAAAVRRLQYNSPQKLDSMIRW